MTEESVSLADKFDLMNAFFEAGFFVQLTVVVLVFASVYGFSIILKKHKEFKTLKKHDDLFLNYFKNKDPRNWDKVYTNALTNKGQFPPVFVAAFKELKSLEVQALESSIERDNIERAMSSEVETQVFKLERGLGHLATIGSASPFVGLFGTVVGILTAFQKIGESGSATLSTVGPAISEALVVTAMGLFVAIPAVSFYNHFIGKVKEVDLELNNFANVILNTYRKKGKQIED